VTTSTNKSGVSSVCIRTSVDVHAPLSFPLPYPAFVVDDARLAHPPQPWWPCPAQNCHSFSPRTCSFARVVSTWVDFSPAFPRFVFFPFACRCTDTLDLRSTTLNSVLALHFTCHLIWPQCSFAKRSPTSHVTTTYVHRSHLPLVNSPLEAVLPSTPS